MDFSFFSWEVDECEIVVAAAFTCWWGRMPLLRCSPGYRPLSYALSVTHARRDLPITSLLTSCHAEVPPPTAYYSDETVTISGVATAAVLVLTALGVLCTRRCFRVDFPVAEGPTMMQGVTSTDTEPCLSRDFLYACCHSKRSGRDCATAEAANYPAYELVFLLESSYLYLLPLLQTFIQLVLVLTSKRSVCICM